MLPTVWPELRPGTVVEALDYKLDNGPAPPPSARGSAPSPEGRTLGVSDCRIALGEPLQTHNGVGVSAVCVA